ncbi:hypothetical protein Q0M62_14750 [Staphylococcus aureus]|nr:hypothetical protein [Staphylococcus aureus]
MDINVKVNVDADKAIEKLERIRDLYKEINELKQGDIKNRKNRMRNIETEMRKGVINILV